MFTVILVEPESDGNIGSVARAMKNFGQMSLILVKPAAPLTDDIKAYSMHAYDIYCASRKEHSLECLKEFDLTVGFSANTGTGSKILRNAMPLKAAKKLMSGNVALVFGRESRGLSNTELAMCDIISTIPSSPAYPTLNLSHSVAVVLYELMQEKYGTPAGKVSLATKNRLLESFSSLVGTCTFKSPAAIKLAFRRVMAKSRLTEKEAKSILALFSKLEKKKDA